MTTDISKVAKTTAALAGTGMMIGVSGAVVRQLEAQSKRGYKYRKSRLI